MTTPKVCVLRAPGTNCDVETAFAFEQAGADAERVHLFRLLENPNFLSQFQILCIPGGFSYGDDIGAGVIFSQQLHGRLQEAIAQFLQRDTLLLGICNGFQVLLKSGILPDGAENWGTEKWGEEKSPANSQASQRNATLTWNDNGKYTARWVTLKIDAPQNHFLKGIDRIELPIAHAEGRLVLRDPTILSEWEHRGQIAMRYCQANTNEQNANEQNTDQVLPYPHNPNGSTANIAGLSDASGRILGIMPHPERFIHATQHPQWTRHGLTGDGAGLQLFRNAANYYC